MKEAMIATTKGGKPKGLEQAEALQTIFESLPLGVIVADQRGRIMFSNPAAVRILGLEFIDTVTEMDAAVAGWYLPDQVSLAAFCSQRCDVYRLQS
jgi:PAS domain-containing protein